MKFKTTVKTIAFAALFATSALPVCGQDLLARQAPVDRKMKSLDTLALQNIIKKETAQSPASALYEEWDNTRTHHITALPDSFLIDLRHFCMPTPSRVLTSNFGPRWGGHHKGLDIKVYIGDTIRAAFSGKVRIVKYEATGFGKYIIIRHPNGLETTYAHLSKQLVTVNEDVKAGDPIGLGGNTGRSTGSHLHFETRLSGNRRADKAHLRCNCWPYNCRVWLQKEDKRGQYWPCRSLHRWRRCPIYRRFCRDITM